MVRTEYEAVHTEYIPPSGILPPWHKRVRTCLYNVWQYYSASADRHTIVHQLTDMVHTFLEMYRHVCTCLYISQIVYVYTCPYMVRTWYVHSEVWTCTYIVQTCMYMCYDVYTRMMYIRDSNDINMYIQCTNVYMQSLCSWCSVYRWLHTDHECTYIVEECMYTDISFRLQLFDSPCWLACRLGLAAVWSQLFKFKHMSLISSSLRTLFSLPPHATCLPLP